MAGVGPLSDSGTNGPKTVEGRLSGWVSRSSAPVREEVKNEMHRYKRGRAKSGRGGKGGKVKSRKQAIAIALSKARKKGKKVPRKKR